MAEQTMANGRGAARQPQGAGTGETGTAAAEERSPLSDLHGPALTTKRIFSAASSALNAEKRNPDHIAAKSAANKEAVAFLRKGGALFTVGGALLSGSLVWGQGLLAATGMAILSTAGAAGVVWGVTYAAARYREPIVKAWRALFGDRKDGVDRAREDRLPKPGSQAWNRAALALSPYAGAGVLAASVVVGNGLGHAAEVALISTAVAAGGWIGAGAAITKVRSRLGLGKS
jgi:hypothetical protein